VNPIITTLSDHGVLVLALLALFLGFVSTLLLRRVERLQRRLRAAERSAEEAACAAALAAPGGIDPEVVLRLLREGRPPTLDNVYALMRLGDHSLEAHSLNS